MDGGFWDRDAAFAVSPAVGAVAPALWMWLQAGAGMNAISIGGPCLWALAGMVVSYAVALPMLVVARRLGLRGLLTLWLVAGLVGAPVGYVWANPASFADDPSVTPSPYWGFTMFGYMALFGITGLLYAVGAGRSRIRA